MLRNTSIAIAVLIASTIAAAENPGPRKHHVGVQLGVLWPSTETLELDGGDVALDRRAFLGILSYRYALTPVAELGVELRHWIGRWPSAASRRTKAAAGFVGPGIRFHPAQTGRVAPYVQFNVYWVQEQVSLSKMHTADGWGWGLSGGLDVTVTDWISIPLEATYIGSVGDALDDLSGFGLSGGVDFQF